MGSQQHKNSMHGGLSGAGDLSIPSLKLILPGLGGNIKHEFFCGIDSDNHLFSGISALPASKHLYLRSLIHIFRAPSSNIQNVARRCRSGAARIRS